MALEQPVIQVNYVHTDQSQYSTLYLRIKFLFDKYMYRYNQITKILSKYETIIVMFFLNKIISPYSTSLYIHIYIMYMDTKYAKIVPEATSDDCY